MQFPSRISHDLTALIQREDNLDAFLSLLKQSPEIKDELENLLLHTSSGDMNLLLFAITLKREKIAIWLANHFKEPDTVYQK